MANECLVTKLKGVVDNPNLPKLGEIKFKCYAEENFNGKWLSLTTVGEPITINVYGTGSFTVGEDPTVRYTYTLQSGNCLLKFSNGTYEGSIIGKYGLSAWSQQVDTGHNNSQIELNIEDFKYSPITVVTASGNKKLYGNIDNGLNKPNLTTFVVAGSELEGTWDGIPSDIQYLNINNTKIGGHLLYCPNKITNMSFDNRDNVFGSLDDLSSRTNISRVSFIRTNGVSGGRLESLGGNVNIEAIALSEHDDYSGFNGSIEAFVAAQVAAGRTSCSISSPIACPWLLHVATFGGQKYNVTGYMYLTWDSANKITIYHGNSSVQNCPNIYAKGATQQEIAAWEQAGKNVIVIS